MRHLKKVAIVGMLLGVASMVGCAYGGAATVGSDTVVITRNDGFLFGALNSVYVCKATASGLSNCRTGESP